MAKISFIIIYVISYFSEIGCQDDSECPVKQACINRECTNPCRRLRCSGNDLCQVNNHVPECEPSKRM